jgi:chromosome segregation ATPase
VTLLHADNQFKILTHIHCRFQPPRRKFGTALSSNTPPRSSIKKVKARKSARKRPAINSLDTSAVGDASNTVTYSVSFPAGSLIGLHIEPYNNKPRVQELVKGGTAAAIGTIRVGDILLQICGTEIQSYDDAVEILKDISAVRDILFQRAHLSLDGRSISSSSSSNEQLYIDSLLPGSFHVSSSLSSTAESPTAGQAASTATSDFDTPPLTDCHTIDQQGDEHHAATHFASCLSPSIVRRLVTAGNDRKQLVTPVKKPRYNVLIQVFQGVAASQQFISHAIGTKLTDKLSLALGGNGNDEVLAVTLEKKSRVMHELHCASQTLIDNELFRTEPRETVDLKQEDQSAQAIGYAIPFLDEPSAFDAELSASKSSLLSKSLPPSSPFNHQLLQQNRDLVDQVQRLQQQLCESDERYKVATVVSGEELKALREENDMLSGELHRNETACSAASVEISTLQQTLDEALQRIESLIEDKSVLQFGLQELEAKAVDASLKESSLLASCESLTTDLAAARADHCAAIERLCCDLEKQKALVDLVQKRAESAESKLSQAVVGILKQPPPAQVLEAVSNESSISEGAALLHGSQSLSPANRACASPVTRLKRALEAKEDELSTKSSVVLDLQDLLDVSRARLFRTKEELESAHRTIGKLEAKSIFLNSKLSSVSKEAKEETLALAREVQLLKSGLAETDAKRADLDVVLGSLCRNLSVSESRAAELREQLEVERKATTEARTCFQETRHDIDERICDAVTRLQLEKDLNTSLRDERRKLVSQVQTLQQELIKSNGQAELSKAKLASAKAAFDDERSIFASRLAAEQQSCFELSDKLSSVISEAAASQQNLERCKREMESNEERLRIEMVLESERLTQAIVLKDLQIKELQQTCDNLQDKVTELNRLHDYLLIAKHELEKQAITVAALREESTKQLEVVNDNHKQEVERLTAECMEAKETCSAAEVEREVAEQRLLHVQESYDTTRIERDQLLSDIRQLTCELREGEGLASKMRDEIDTLVREKNSFNDQIKALEDLNQGLKTSLAVKMDLHVRQKEQLDTLMTQLEQEHTSARAEAESLRNDLQERFTELQKLNGILESHIESTRLSLKNSTKELTTARSELAESRSATSALEEESASQQAKTQHLEARSQALDASLSRMESENLRLTESVRKLAQETSAADDLNAETNPLHAAHPTRTNKIESISAVYHAQQRLLAHSQIMEAKLIEFAEKIISDVSTLLQPAIPTLITKGLCVRALDPADVGAPTAEIGQSDVMESVMACLERSRDSLNHLKQQRIERLEVSGLSTPPPKSKSNAIPDTPSVLEALERVKSLLQTDMFSPDKARRARASPVDIESFHKLVSSLEIQISDLVCALKSANDDLLAKDKQSAELERLLVAHHEHERETLGLSLDRLTERIRTLEDQLEQEAALRNDLEQQAIQLRHDSKREAGRLIAHFLQHRSRNAKASALTKWACEAAVTKAVKQQKLLSERLSGELDFTREKLSLLKRLLKKLRRGRESGLQSILENSEADDE